ncbi:MAG: hypothetical protein AAGA85_20785 [Bacteroidota bacterium]
MKSLTKLLTCCTLGLLGFAHELRAQSIGHSAYNAFGLGTLEQVGLVPYEHMGYAAIGSRIDDVVNLENPAGLTSIRGFTHSFDFGLSFSQLTQESPSDISTGTFGGLHDLNVWFRLNQKTAISVGLSKYSDATFDILDRSTDGSESRLVGDGGSSQAFLAAGYSLLPNLHLGVQGSLLFGSLQREEFLTISDPSAALQVTTTESFVKPLLKLGLQNEYKLGSKARVVLGATYEAGGSTQVSIDEVITSSVSLGRDSLFSEDFSTLQLPQKIGFGIGIAMKSWNINLDYELEDWATNEDRSRFSFQDRWLASGGIQYRKDRFSSRMIERVAFRMGGGVHSNYVAADNESYLNPYFSLGMGIPLLKGAASINVGYQYHTSGTTADNLIMENAHTFSFSLTIRDIWFGKRIYN